MDEADRRRLEEIGEELDALDAAANVAAVASDGLRLSEEALTLHSKEADPERWARLQFLLGRYALTVGIDTSQLDLFRRAVAACEAAQTIYGDGADIERWSSAQHNKALALSYLGQYSDDPATVREAIAAFREGLNQIDREAKPADWASSLNSLGSAQLRLGIDLADVSLIRKAMECYEEAIPVWRQSDEPDQAGLSVYNLGFALSALGELTGDPDCFERSIATFGELEGLYDPATRPRDWANITNSTAIARANLGLLLGDPAEIEEAVAGFASIRTVMTREAYPAWWSMASTNYCAYSVRLAELRSDPSGLVLAAETATAALEVATETDLPSYWTSLTTVAADARFRLGERLGDPSQLNLAIDGATVVLESPGVVPRDRGVAAQLRGRARMELARRRDDTDALESAIADFDLAFTVRSREASPAHWTKTALARAEARRLLGERLGRSDLLADAMQDCTEVLGMLAHAEAGLDRAEAHLLRGQAGLALLQIEDAGMDPTAVVDDFRTAKGALRADLDPIAMVQARKGEIIAVLWAGDLERAAADADGLLTDAAALLTAEPADHARLRLAEALTGIGDVAAYARCRLGQPEAAIAAHERGRAHRLRERLRLAEAGLSEARQHKLEVRRQRLETARRALAAALDQDRPAAAIARLSESLTRQHAALMDQFRRYGLADAPSTPDVETVSDSARGGAVVVPVTAPPGGAALVIDASGLAAGIDVLMLPDLTTTAIDNLLRGRAPVGWLPAYAQFRDALAGTGGTASGDSLTAFHGAVERMRTATWRLLMGPLDAHLRARGMAEEAEIVLIPDGRLSTLPLHAAGEADVCFLDRWAVSYAPSLSARAACWRRSQGRGGGSPRLLAVTDPAQDLGWPVNPASGFFPPEHTDTFYGAEARRAAVVTALPDATYVSFFTHAEWDADRPERSCIRLAGDDRIEARDFAELALHRCRMVVLGACESGVPGLGAAPDEFQGMPACLIQAGVPGVLATLWPVFNRAADALLEHFFRAHLNAGLTPAVALRRAQLACRDAAGDQPVRSDARFAMMDAEAPAALGIRRSAPAAGEAKAIPVHDQRQPMYWAAFTYTGT